MVKWEKSNPEMGSRRRVSLMPQSRWLLSQAGQCQERVQLQIDDPWPRTPGQVFIYTQRCSHPDWKTAGSCEVRWDPLSIKWRVIKPALELWGWNRMACELLTHIMLCEHTVGKHLRSWIYSFAAVPGSKPITDH